MYPFLQASQQQICISRSLTPASQGDVNCIFCIEFFSGLSRSQGTKNGILLPTPTLDVQSASVHANNSKFPEESTIQHHTMFTLQDTANASPQMLLDNPKFISSMSSLLEKVSQNGLNIHTLKKSLEMVTHQATPYGCPKIQWDPLHSTGQALSKKVTTDHRRMMMPHIGCQLSHRGIFQGSNVSCSCSGCWFFND